MLHPRSRIRALLLPESVMYMTSDHSISRRHLFPEYVDKYQQTNATQQARTSSALETVVRTDMSIGTNGSNVVFLVGAAALV